MRVSAGGRPSRPPSTGAAVWRLRRGVQAAQALDHVGQPLLEDALMHLQQGDLVLGTQAPPPAVGAAPTLPPPPASAWLYAPGSALAPVPAPPAGTLATLVAAGCVAALRASRPSPLPRALRVRGARLAHF